MSTVSVRYFVNDVDTAIDFYTRHLGFEVRMHPAAVEFLDPIVSVIRDVDVSVRIHGNAAGFGKLSVGRSTTAPRQEKGSLAGSTIGQKAEPAD